MGNIRNIPAPVLGLANDWVRQRFSVPGTSVTGVDLQDELLQMKLAGTPAPFSTATMYQALRALIAEGLVSHGGKGDPYVRLDPHSQVAHVIHVRAGAL